MHRMSNESEQPRRATETNSLFTGYSARNMVVYFLQRTSSVHKDVGDDYALSLMGPKALTRRLKRRQPGAVGCSGESESTACDSDLGRKTL
jgi:hypothetical protein